MTNILTPLYGHTGSPNINNIHSHRLSVFFILLASGALYEQSSSSGVMAEQYHALSRAALSLDPIHQDATCATVQALFMATRHIYLTDCANNEGRWLLMGVVGRVAQLVSTVRFRGERSKGANNNLSQIGLRKSIHTRALRQSLMQIAERDSAGWGLGHEETQRRRILFWEVYTCDAWTVRVFIFDLSLFINFELFQRALAMVVHRH